MLRHAPAGRADREVHGAGVGELHRVGDEVAQHLLEALLVGVQGDRQGRRDPHLELQVLVQRDRLEGRLDVVDQLDEGDPGRPDVHLARLHLGQVEDVVDQLEQVGPGAVNGVGELDLLGREVALVVVGEQLGQDQQRVQRGAQLVRHVGEELALVPGGQRELFGALLQHLPRLLDLAVLDLDVTVLLSELLGLLLQLLVGALQFLLARLQLRRPHREFRSQPLGLQQQALGLGVDADGVDGDADEVGDLVEEVQRDGGEGAEGGQLDHPQQPALEQHRQHHDVGRRGLAQTGGDLQVPGRRLLEDDRPLLHRGLADQRLTGVEGGRHRPALVAVAADQPQHGVVLVVVLRDQLGGAAGRLGEEEGAVLGRDHRGELGHDQRGHRLQIAPALEQTGDPGQVGLQPVLLLVGAGGLAQVGDHLVDVVLELVELAGGVQVDPQRQVAPGHRGGDLGDRAHLPGEVVRQLVDGLGEVLPGAVHARHPGLAAEPPVGTHLAGDPGDLVGERRQLVHHGVDAGLELQDLAARVDVDLLRQVAARHRRDHQRDVPHLTGQVVRHQVDVVGQVLPDAGHARHPRLAAQDAVGAHLAGHPGDLHRERGQLVDHGVERPGQRRDLALRLDGDLLGEVARGHRRRHLGDVPHLAGEVRGHEVDVVGQVLPDARHPAHPGLSAEVALGTHLARHPGHLVGERRQLVHHGVHGGDQLQDLAPGIDGDLLRDVPAGHRGGHLGDVADLAGQVVGHQVDAVGEVLPGAGHPRHARLTAEDALGADVPGHPGHLVRERGQLVDHGVDGVLQLQDLAPGVHLDLLREVAPGHRRGHLGDVPHLVGEVVRHEVDVVGEVPPDPGRPRHLRLTAEPPLGTHLPGHPGHLLGEARELVHHRVDGVLQLQDLPARVHLDLLREVAARHRRGHLGDAADLTRQIVRHEVHRVGEVPPDPGDTRHLRLAAQPALGTHVPGHAGHLGREAVQLVHHRVDGVLQLQHLAGHFDRHLAGQVALGHRGRHLRDVAHLRRQPAGHGVDRVREVLPAAGDAADLRLAAQLALGTDLAGHPGHLVGELRQLVHQPVDGTADLQVLAAQRVAHPVAVQRAQLHLLVQVALGDRAQHPAHLGHRPRQVVDQRVAVVDRRHPGALAGPGLQPLVQPTLAAHRAAHPGQLARQVLVALRHLVEHRGDLRQRSVPGHRQPAPEVSVPHRRQRGQQLAQLGRLGAAVVVGTPTGRAPRRGPGPPATLSGRRRTGCVLGGRTQRAPPRS